jgi:glycine oxidase
VASPTVIIIGAGIIGCACAYDLAEAGARVSVFDARAVGQGASQASAGVLAPAIEGHHSSEFRELGRRSLALYDDYIARVTAVSGLTVQYTRSGTLEIALEAEDADRLSEGGRRLSAAGIEARWLSAEQLQDAEPLAAAGARGALLIPSHAFVGVPDLTAALAAAAMQNGATFALDTPVVSISPGPSGLIVQTHTGPSPADYVILAAGSWSGQIEIAGVQPVAVKPVRGQLLHLAWPTEQPLRHVLWGTDCYIVPWLNGRVLVGATVEEAGFDERATAAGVRDLLAAGCTLVPRLSQATFTEVRVGLRPASPDALPIVGRSEALPGLIYATGHYRNGVLLAPLTASLVKQIVMRTDDGDPALQILKPSRFGRL